MSTVEEITAAIERLSAADVARVRAWLAEYAERLWDEQIEHDERAGRLDALIDGAGAAPGRSDSPAVNHHTTADFWGCDARLPEAAQRVADRHHALLRADPRHPSLHFKKVGRLWSVRAGPGIGPWRPRRRMAWSGSGSDRTMNTSACWRKNDT